jgi:alkanesulfonate monooxygenase SsuD/methylene tetrahydromethanopterin reductase-like flavin-dependent oxidoreductase (luciferase family)
VILDASTTRAVPRLAISVMPLENRLDVIRGLAGRAERLGYEAFLVPETWSYDAHALLATIAAETERIALGPAVINCWSRSPGMIAMGAATLAAVSRGRSMLGLGAGSPQLAEGLHDQVFEHPAERLRQTVVQVQALLRGERVPLTAASATRPLKLNLSLAFEIPIWMAALGQRTISLAGEHADGWLPFLVPLSTLPARIQQLRDSAARVGRAQTAITIAPAVPVAVADKPEDARRIAEWFVAFYVVSMGDIYREQLAAAGFRNEVRAILDANPTPRTAIVPPTAQRLLDELTIHGTPDTARGQLQHWYDAGADTIGLLLAPQLTPAQLELTLDTFAPDQGTFQRAAA